MTGKHVIHSASIFYSTGGRMGAFVDLTGNRYGKLTVAHRAENKGRYSAWVCVCECGGATVVRGVALKQGKTRSCGCLRQKVMPEHKATYSSWYAMLGRCYDPKRPLYSSYGGRGVTVCDRWLVFSNFLEDMGTRPAGLSLDRIDVNSGYGPSNCRWANSQTQNRNRTNNRLLTHCGETKTAADWADALGLSVKRFHAYLRYCNTVSEVAQRAHIDL